MMYPRNSPRTRWLLVLIMVVVGLIAIVAATGAYFMATEVHPLYWFPFSLFPLIFIPLFFLFFFGFRWFLWGCGWGRGWYYRQHDPALAALRERYAMGEITKDQLNQMTRDLES